MKRLKLCLLALIICFGLCGCEGIGFTSIRRYADCMNRNWHLNLPETDVEIYVKDSGASFTGDGIRYHILQYDKESADIILKSFDWEAGELDSELADKMEEWLDTNLFTEEGYAYLIGVRKAERKADIHFFFVLIYTAGFSSSDAPRLNPG